MPVLKDSVPLIPVDLNRVWNAVLPELQDHVGTLFNRLVIAFAARQEVGVPIIKVRVIDNQGLYSREGIQVCIQSDTITKLRSTCTNSDNTSYWSFGDPIEAVCKCDGYLCYFLIMTQIRPAYFNTNSSQTFLKYECLQCLQMPHPLLSGEWCNLNS